ncbi:small multi-drug export protein [Candidatus Woesearchaeota archaeon]|nr:small multi-drug export protein [Candidatus Woesearchaeota archaeon]
MLDILQVILVSILPIAELRGGIPLAYGLGLSPAAAYIVAVAANIAIVPVIFFFLDYLHKHFMRIPPYRKLFNHFLERARRNAEAKLKRWGYFGLVLFVGIPLPITGAYTGTLAAWFFELERKKAMLAIALGVMMAGVIVSLVMITGTSAFQIFVK